MCKIMEDMVTDEKKIIVICMLERGKLTKKKFQRV